jgi:diguanylate cyclase (GGDEF)-like protein/PAS domain S-box-containing protein
MRAESEPLPTPLGEGEAFFRLLFEHTQDGVVIIDAEANIVAVNPAFADITGYAESELMHRNPFLMRSGHHGQGFYQGIWPKLDAQEGWAGEIWNRRKNGEVHPAWLSISVVRDARGRVTHYIGVVTDLAPARRAQKALNQMAHYDALTGLPNRPRLEARLGAMIARADYRHQRLGVLLMDLDHFRHINDTFGLPVGDMLLRQATERLKACIPGDGFVARLSGDEIVLVSETKNGPDAIAAIAERAHRSLDATFAAGAQEVFLTASIGISLYPENGEDAVTLIKNADVASHRAKEQGGSCTCFYSEGFSRDTAARLALETALRRALEREELELHYQPQVNLANGRPTGLEALVRWRHPEHGLLLPGRFIPQAEVSGLIEDIDEWVLQQACRQMADWRRQGIAPSRLAINLSARQFGRIGLLTRIGEILADTGLSPAALELEITESTIMENPEAARRVLAELADMQIDLAIDDFGTGYSSLAYLQRFHAHRLKVDRAFIRHLPLAAADVTLCRAIMQMAEGLGLQVVAEGIEHERQRRFLAEAGCTTGQGWLFAPAMSAASTAQWLVQHQGMPMS